VEVTSYHRINLEWRVSQCAIYEIGGLKLILDKADAGQSFTMNDPIVEEVRRVRETHAARFNYDIDAIFQDIKKREKESGLVFVLGVARQSVQPQAAPATGTTFPIPSGSGEVLDSSSR
jgi:hypothetical protein